MASSKIKTAIARVLKEEGYVADVALNPKGRRRRSPLASILRRPPGHRSHRARQSSRPADLPRQGRAAKVLGGMGTVIVSTPQGVMTDKQARSIGQGGEVLCIVA